MNSLDLQLLEILSNALNGSPIEEIQDWPALLQEMKIQAVLGLPYETIKRSGCLSKEQVGTYQRLCFQVIAKNMQLFSEQQKMVDLFESHQIPFVILKGSSAAIYYPHPEYRSMGDIDIIVKPADFDRAYEVLHKYYKCIQTLNDNPRHASFVGETGVEIELHKFFSHGERNEKKELLDQMIYAGIDRREWKEIAGHQFPSLPPIENGLVLLSHVYQHLQNTGIGYRQLADFRQFVEAEQENLEAFLAAAESVGLSGLAEALICVYEKYMGVSVGLKFTPIRDEVINELMHAITNSGNFGRKETMDAGRRAEIVMKKSRNPFILFRTLQRYGRSHWRASEKYVFLRPFAWIYQIGYYIHQARINGGLSVITKGKNRITTKEKLFEELGL